MISDRHKFIFVHAPRSGGSIFSNEYINTYRYVHAHMNHEFLKCAEDEKLAEEEGLKKVNELLLITQLASADVPRRLGKKVNFPGKRAPASVRKIPQKHFVCEEYKKHCLDEWENYYKFGIVRNPWEHLVSLYFMRRTQPVFIKKDGTFLKFHEWCERWFKIDYEHSLYDLYYFIGDEMVLDDAVRFENYNEEMGKVWEKLFNTEMPYTINKDKTEELWKERKLSDRPADYRDLYKGEGSKYINSVRSCYPKIIEYFGYDLEL